MCHIMLLTFVVLKAKGIVRSSTVTCIMQAGEFCLLTPVLNPRIVDVFK